jgi:hypothetical protein
MAAGHFCAMSRNVKVVSARSNVVTAKTPIDARNHGRFDTKIVLGLIIQLWRKCRMGRREQCASHWLVVEPASRRPRAEVSGAVQRKVRRVSASPERGRVVGARLRDC